MDRTLRIAIAQVAPVFLDRDRTIAKACDCVRDAALHGARLVCFGEAFVPAYPVWLSRTDGARFDDPGQKALHARYVDQGVDIDAGHLRQLQETCAASQCAVVIGVMERPQDRGGHSLFCSRVVIDERGTIASVHRKLMPTYEERLAWSPGDGNGLVTHPVGPFTLSALNCWENWMPLARAALYAQGTNLHVAIWPGSLANTQDITRFIAREGRTYVISASAILRNEDLPDDVPLRDRILEGDPLESFHNGGSCVANPDGTWLVEPVVGEERVIHATLELDRVYEERQNFDPSGHYARPDVLRLTVDRRRQSAIDVLDDEG